MATLKDVAKEAGLSVGTVSRVLNNRGYISDETRDNVKRAMARLNYQPNEVARSLSKQNSNTIGVIIPSIEHPYFAKVLSCLEQAAHEQGYKLLLFCSRGETSREDEYIKACRSNRVAALILCTGSVRTSRMRNLGFPLITYERFINTGDAGVECDNYEGGRFAARELIQAGCRKLVCLRAIQEVSLPADSRKDGFLDECRDSGVDAYDYSFPPENLDDMEYRDLIRKFLDACPEADGVFAGSDVIAAQVLQVCKQRGIRVPQDLKVVGYDDVLLSQMTTPDITTIHQPVREMAEACVDIVRRSAEGESLPSRTTFHVSLIRRGSTAVG